VLGRGETTSETVGRLYTATTSVMYGLSISSALIRYIRMLTNVRASASEGVATLLLTGLSRYNPVKGLFDSWLTPNPC